MSRIKLSKKDAYKIFIDFLDNSGYYNQFVNALNYFGKYGNRTIVEAFDYMETHKYNYNDIINVMLPWSKTIEGSGFWLKIHNMYRSSYNELAIKNKRVGYKSIW